jgi:hypothetical protein
VIGHLIDRDQCEAIELDLGYRPHACRRQAHGESRNRGLRDRRVPNAIRTEAVQESLRGTEYAAIAPDILSQHEDPIILGHCTSER